MERLVGGLIGTAVSAVLLTANPAEAGDVHVGIHIGAGYVPAPFVLGPAPVVVTPPVVVVAPPPPVVLLPSPTYVIPTPPYADTQVYVVAPRHGHRPWKHWKKWKKKGHRDDDDD